MAKLNTIFVALLLSVNFGFAQTVNWIHHPGYNEGAEKIDGFQMDDQGNSYIVGRVDDTTDMDPSANSVWFYPYLYNTASTPGLFYLQKIDPSGNVVWTKGWEYIDPNGESSVVDIEIMDNQYIYVTGWFQGDLRVDIGPNADTMHMNSFVNSYLFKIDLNGNFISKTSFPSNGDVSVGAMTIDNDNNIILCGTLTGSPDMNLTGGAPFYITSAGYKDCFTAKYDSSLQLIWAHRFGGNGHEDIFDVATDDAGNIISTGSHQSSSNDFDPGPGVSSLPYVASYDGFVHKVDRNGNFLWVRGAASNGNSSLRNLAIGANNELITQGIFSNNIAIDYPTNSTFESPTIGSSASFIWVLDSNGVSSWNKITSGSATHDVNFVKVSGNEIAFGGRVYTNSDVNFGSTALPYIMDTTTTGYIAKYDLNGNLLSTYELKGGYSVVSNLEYFNNEMYIAGKWNGKTDFNSGPAVDTLTADWLFDFFVARVSPSNLSIDEYSNDGDNSLVYPNPVRTNQTFHFSNDFTQVEVFNHLGQLISTSKELETIKTPGFYTLRFHTDHGITQRELIVYE